MAAGSRRARAAPEAAGSPAARGAPEPDRRASSAAAMSLGTGDPASETGDDSLSVITFDSDLETRAKRKSFHKPPPTSPKSPYHSKPRKVASWRSLKTAASLPLGNRMSLTPQKLWLGSPKPGCVPGTPVYREKEDMYDEIIELKKFCQVYLQLCCLVATHLGSLSSWWIDPYNHRVTSASALSLHTQKSDADLMRAKLRRLEEENGRKDRQIEQLLDPSRGPDFVRTLAEKRPDTGWVVNGLKQRVLKLEQQCKDKDSTIHKLQTDMKTTNLEEMRIAMETYYEEIHRLQTLLASSEATGRKLPMEKKSGLKRQKKMSSALLSLSRSVQELTEENRTLKEDLDRVLSNSPTTSTTKGYTEWSKPRLLRRIAELEKKLSSMESPRSQTSEADRSDSLGHSASSSTVHGQPRSECHEESERLRGAVRSLKGERKALQAQLQKRDLEVKQLLQAKADLQKELEDVKGGEKERRQREEALREEVQTLTKKFQELEETKKEEEGDPMDVTPEPQEQPRPCLPASSRSQQAPEPHDASAPCTCSEGRRQAAARLLQARWKAHRHQKTKAVLDEAATVLQAAFRGHQARMKLLSSKLQNCPEPCLPSPVVHTRGDPGQEEAITIIQSLLRAHLARTGHRVTRQRTTSAAPAKRRSAPAAPSEPASPPRPAVSGSEDSEVSSGDMVEGPAPEDEDGAPRGPGAPAALWPCPAESPPSGLQPVVPPHVEDVSSDDSDEIVIAPSLTIKKSAPVP